MPTPRRGLTIAAASGVAFGVVLAARTIIIPSPPPLSEGEEALAAYFADNRTLVLAAGYLTGFIVAFGTWFAAGLRRRLRSGGDGLAGDVAFGSWVVIGAIALVRFAFGSTVAFIPEYDLGVLTFAGTANAIMLSFLWFAYALLVFATAYAAWHSKVFPLWHTFASSLVVIFYLVAASGVMVRTGSLAPNGSVATAGIWVTAAWTGITGLLLLTRPRIDLDE
ncbi:MAG: hypothetical protein WD757_04680 [Actinomycetota bacterium]